MATANVPSPRAVRANTAEATRARLLAVTIETLERGGEQSLRVGEIATAADVSIGTVYHHFESRTGLLVAARAEQFLGMYRHDFAWLRSMLASVESRDGLKLGLLTVIRETHGAHRTDSRWRRIDVLGLARHNPDLAALIAEAQHAYLVELVDLLRPVQARGLISSGLDLAALATAFQSLQFGRILVDASPPGDDEFDRWLGFMEQLLTALLAID